jgi:hypothetical protein
MLVGYMRVSSENDHVLTKERIMSGLAAVKKRHYPTKG